jgi:DNA-binding CsgD family transcriptional regulator
MRKKLTDMADKVVTLLTENQYMTTREIADKTHLSVNSVRVIIKHLRSQVGIISSRKGHILAEYASVQDDVEFLRRLNGRRASDVMSLEGVRRHIEKRWKTLGYNRQLNLSMKSLDSDVTVINNSIKLLSSLKF